MDPEVVQEEDDRRLLDEAFCGARGQHQRRIASVGVRWIATLLRKNADYGSSVWHVPVLAPDCTADAAIRVRMSDKINRIHSLMMRIAEVKDETIEDTIGDLGAYCLLLLAKPK